MINQLAHVTRAALATTLLLFAFGTAANAVIFEGSLGASLSTWDRIKDSGSTQSTNCDAIAQDSYNDDLPFATFDFTTPNAPGPFSAIVYSDYGCDTVLALYCDGFDPALPKDNLVAVDDDSGGYPIPQLEGFTLDPNDDYTLVLTRYSAYGNCGDFLIDVTGVCNDVDSDGFSGAIDCGDYDCDDTDGSIYPGAVELCDGVDNDCDDEIDEGCVQTFAEEITFSAIPAKTQVTLTWTAVSEENVFGYNILRRQGKKGEYEQINDTLIVATGSIETTVDYEFIDADVKNGKPYYYKLIEVETDGAEREHGPERTTPRRFYGLLSK